MGRKLVNTDLKKEKLSLNHSNNYYKFIINLFLKKPIKALMVITFKLAIEKKSDIIFIFLYLFQVERR